MTTSIRPNLRQLKWQNKTLVQLFDYHDPTPDSWWQAFENAYHNYPDEYFENIRGRLEGETGLSMGAIWELYLWQLLTESGCQVQIEQPIPNSTKSVDFLINTDSGFVAYIEATTKSLGPAAEDKKRFYFDLNNTIYERIDVPYTLISVITRTESPTLPDANIICEQIFDWVNSEFSRIVVGKPISFELQTIEGWVFRIEFSKTESAPSHKIFMGPGEIVDEVENTREGLLYKIQKLESDPGAPYIIAIALSPRLGLSTVFGKFSALFGSPAVRFDKSTGETSETFTNIWNQHQSDVFTKFVSGYLFGSGTYPGFEETQQLDLWINPRATHLINPSLVPFDCLVHCVTDKGLMKTRSGPGNTWVPADISDTL
jgi:hypothetical protein